MAATPKRAKAVEAALVGQPWNASTVEAAMAAYAADFTPISDMRASAEYRMLAARNLLKRFWLETTGTAKADPGDQIRGGVMRMVAGARLSTAVPHVAPIWPASHLPHTGEITLCILGALPATPPIGESRRGG